MGKTYTDRYAPGLIQITSSNLDVNLAVTTKAAAMTVRQELHNILVYLDVSVAPTGSTIICDITVNGTTIFSTKPTIDISELTSTTAATPYVLSTTTLEEGDKVVVKIDQIGSTVAGKDLLVSIKGDVV